MEKLPTSSILCQVHAIKNLGADVYQLKLQLPEQTRLEFYPGQYLMLAAENGEFYPFSIASTPQQLPQIELHILARNNAAVQLIKEFEQGSPAIIQPPCGDVRLQDSGKPLLLIAAGTGLAQMHSMLEHCRITNSNTQIDLYWGAKSADEFYQVPAWSQWQKMPNVRLHKVVSHNRWQGRNGMLHEAVCEDIQDFGGLQVFVSGSPNMVYTTLDAFVSAGMQKQQMQADVFSFAPRQG